jgi:hypothetical protein
MSTNSITSGGVFAGVVDAIEERTGEEDVTILDHRDVLDILDETGPE